MTKLLAFVTVVLVLSGCVSSQVQRGALIGAAAGVVAGGTVGVLMSDKHLLGFSDSKDSGNIPLPKGGTIAAGVAVGAMLGAIVGAMIGHRRDEGYEDVPAPAAAPTPTSASSIDDGQQQARAPHLLGL